MNKINKYILILNNVINNLIEIKELKSKIDKKDKIEKWINIIKNDLNTINNLGLPRNLNIKDKKGYDNLLRDIDEQIDQVNNKIIKYKNRIKQNNKILFIYFRTNLNDIIYYLDILNNTIKWIPNYH